MDYASIDQIQAFADEPDITSPDAWALLATAASRLFDKLTDVPDNFYAANDGSTTARTFYGDGTAYLRLDPFVSTPTPTVSIPGGEYTVETTDFIVEGSSLVLTAKAKRLNDIAASFPNRFTGWRDLVAITVTAKWGFAEIPQDVVYAVCQIALMLWRQREPAVAVTAGLEGVGTQDLPKTAQMIVDQYRKTYSRMPLFA